MLFKPFINLWSQNVEDILFSVALKFILKFIFSTMSTIQQLRCQIILAIYLNLEWYSKFS